MAVMGVLCNDYDISVILPQLRLNDMVGSMTLLAVMSTISSLTTI